MVPHVISWIQSTISTSSSTFGTTFVPNPPVCSTKPLNLIPSLRRQSFCAWSGVSRLMVVHKSSHVPVKFQRNRVALHAGQIWASVHVSVSLLQLQLVHHWILWSLLKQGAWYSLGLFLMPWSAMGSSLATHFLVPLSLVGGASSPCSMHKQAAPHWGNSYLPPHTTAPSLPATVREMGQQHTGLNARWMLVSFHFSLSVDSWNLVLYLSCSSWCSTTGCHVWICGKLPRDGILLLAASSYRSTEWSDHWIWHYLHSQQWWWWTCEWHEQWFPQCYSEDVHSSHSVQLHYHCIHQCRNRTREHSDSGYLWVKRFHCYCYLMSIISARQKWL